MVLRMSIRWNLLCFMLLLSLTLPVNAELNSLDTLFINLKNVANEAEARKLENLIWQRWFESGNSAVDDLMQAAMRKRSGYDFNGALEILNQVIEINSDYSEAWNQRATVFFHQQDYEKSLLDIARTLELEPRHFGALAGRAVIRLYQSKPALARQNIIEALKFHPYLKEKAMFPDL